MTRREWYKEKTQMTTDLYRIHLCLLCDEVCLFFFLCVTLSATKGLLKKLGILHFVQNDTEGKLSLVVRMTHSVSMIPLQAENQIPRSSQTNFSLASAAALAAV